MIEMPVKEKEFGKVNNRFNRLYKHNQATTIGNLIFEITENKTMDLIKELRLKKDAKIIDIGCGIGRTLMLFRKNRFANSIGVDNSKGALGLCSGKGLVMNKDVFFADAKNLKFPKNHFDLVFEEGLLEHFKKFQPFVNEMCRISKRYVVLIQPNKFSLAHKVMDIFTPDINIKELSYRVSEFREAFQVNNFELTRMKNSFLNIFWILVFEKKR